ncbi:unnamed protein product [Linum trigynum]|uniref:Remorin C-terminal domain-containing protein n=1 Tax=Linum trigynum TaxID=586398 RepID=A0AAV2EQM8_9ROSI
MKPSPTQARVAESNAAHARAMKTMTQVREAESKVAKERLIQTTKRDEKARVEMAATTSHRLFMELWAGER